MKYVHIFRHIARNIYFIKRCRLAPSSICARFETEGRGGGGGGAVGVAWRGVGGWGGGVGVKLVISASAVIYPTRQCMMSICSRF